MAIDQTMVSQKSAKDIVYLIYKCFLFYNNRFYKITKGAKHRFEQKKWPLQIKAVHERTILKNNTFDKIASHFSGFDHSIYNLEFILNILFLFKSKLKSYPNPDIAYSFCISVLRKLYPIELPFTFLEGSIKGLGNYNKDTNLKYIISSKDLNKDLSSIIKDINFSSDSIAIIDSINKTEELFYSLLPKIKTRIGIGYYKALFYRNNHAYLIGYIEIDNNLDAFCLAFENKNNGILIDGLLIGEKEIINIFSFSRNYLQVDSSSTSTLIEFLKKIIPSKNTAQLYINLGFQEHGKELILLEVYQSIKQKEASLSVENIESDSIFLVLTCEGLDYELKLPIVNSKSKKDLIDKYLSVSYSERIGRLPDIQYYNNLIFPLNSFSEDLQIRFSTTFSNYLSVNENNIVFTDLFIGRRITPLKNLLIPTNDINLIKNLIIDLGNCIKDLALAGNFIENLSIDDFGVLKNNLVVFHNFHKINKITLFNFESKPTKKGAKNVEKTETSELKTIYTELIIDHLFPKGLLNEMMVKEHEEILKPKFWNAMKKANKSINSTYSKPYKSNIY